MVKNIKYGMGWIPDLPDFRDFTVKKPEIQVILSKIGINNIKDISNKDILPTVDLRQYCSPIFDQGQIGSCTANAGVGLLEYFERKSFGKYINGSRLFLYKITRNLTGDTGDTGAYLRNTIGAMVTIGICPERYCPYNVEKYDEEPSALCYSIADDYKAISYVRLDSGISEEELLKTIKTNLSANIPSMFGFTVYSSISQADKTGKIPFPDPNENTEGGHALMVVGYDDNMVITNENKNNKNENTTTGAFLIRNSWGDKWGDKGYGWLPYEYVLKGLALDWWILLNADWIDSGQFGF